LARKPAVVDLARICAAAISHTMQTAGDDVSGAAAARSEESSTSTATIGADASGGMTAEQEMQFQQANTLLEQEKFEEASDILSSLLASRCFFYLSNRMGF
jgi:hypothetical protein